MNETQVNGTQGDEERVTERQVDEDEAVDNGSVTSSCFGGRV